MFILISGKELLEKKKSKEDIYKYCVDKNDQSVIFSNNMQDIRNAKIRSQYNGPEAMLNEAVRLLQTGDEDRAFDIINLLKAINEKYASKKVMASIFTILKLKNKLDSKKLKEILESISIKPTFKLLKGSKMIGFESTSGCIFEDGNFIKNRDVFKILINNKLLTIDEILDDISFEYMMEKPICKDIDNAVSHENMGFDIVNLQFFINLMNKKMRELGYNKKLDLDDDTMYMINQETFIEKQSAGILPDINKKQDRDKESRINEENNIFDFTHEYEFDKEENAENLTKYDVSANPIWAVKEIIFWTLGENAKMDKTKKDCPTKDPRYALNDLLKLFNEQQDELWIEEGEKLPKRATWAYREISDLIKDTGFKSRLNQVAVSLLFDKETLKEYIKKYGFESIYSPCKVYTKQDTEEIKKMVELKDFEF